MLKVNIIGINYAPEIISTAVYTTGLSTYLAARGHQVRVTSALPYYPHWKIKSGWPKARYVTRVEDGVKITHCPLYVPRRPTGLKRILHHLSFAAASLPIALKSALTDRPDVVVVIAPSLASLMGGWLLAKLSGAKLWLHVQDLEVDAAFATGLLKKTTLSGMMARGLEGLLLHLPNRISTISDQMRTRLKQKGVPAQKLLLLRNWADLEPPKAAIETVKARLGITTKYVALYSGNLAYKQGLEILPKAADALQRRDDLTFVICGDGPIKAQLEAQTQGLTNIKFLPLQPKSRLGDLLQIADLHLLPQIENTSDLVMPSKLANMLASARPVVATTQPETALGQELATCGLTVPPKNAPALSRAIERLIDDRSLRRQLGRAALERARTYWGKAPILSQFEAELNRLAPQHRRVATGLNIKETG